MKIEYSLWFSSQMEFQRQYFEDRLKEMEEKIQGVERSADFQVSLIKFYNFLLLGARARSKIGDCFG
jgi:hypothetical protein